MAVGVGAAVMLVLLAAAALRKCRARRSAKISPGEAAEAKVAAAAGGAAETSITRTSWSLRGGQIVSTTTVTTGTSVDVDGGGGFAKASPAASDAPWSPWEGGPEVGELGGLVSASEEEKGPEEAAPPPSADENAAAAAARHVDLAKLGGLREQVVNPRLTFSVAFSIQIS